MLFVVLWTAPALAQQGPLVGEHAPPFVAESCVNAPEIIHSEQLIGEVVLLEFWGTT